MISRQRLLVFSFLFLLLLGFSATNAFSAETQQRAPKGLQMVPQQTKADKVKLARNYIRTRNYSTAVAILESVYEDDSNNSVVNSLLRSCYNQLGVYTKAETLVRRQIDRSPTAYIYRVYLAEALARQGLTDSSYSSYKDAMGLILNDNVAEYKIIINSMLAHSFTSETVLLINQIRERKNDHTLFAYEAGVMLETDGEYAEATNQYLLALADTTKSGSRYASMSENKILSLLMFEKTFSVVEEVLKNQTATLPQVRASRVLSNAYLNKKQLEKAFEYALIRDSLEGANGTSLLQFLRSCVDSRQYHIASRMAKKILELHADSPIFSQTYFLYGDLLVKLGQYDEAIAVYDSVITRFPREVDRLKAAVRIGYIYLNNLREYDRALSIFDSVLSNKGQGGVYFKAMKGIPHAYLRKGELDSARVNFIALQKTRLPQDIKEEALYYLAELDFLQKNIDSCQTGLNRLLVDYPRGLYVNDALELLLLVQDIATDTTLLDLFIDARKYRRMFMIDSTVISLKAVAAADHPDLSSMALFRLGEISIDMFDTVGALGFINQLALRYEDSYYYPYGQKLKAEILLLDPEKRSEGQKLYRALLEKYPNYPFASDLRKTLRQLEEDVKTG